jgi:hypothetical protein
MKRKAVVLLAVVLSGAGVSCGDKVTVNPPVGTTAVLTISDAINYSCDDTRARMICGDSGYAAMSNYTCRWISGATFCIDKVVCWKP